jgi:hypothetical protein
MRKIFTIILITIFSVPAFTQVERKAIVEHFTNSRCSVCASRNPALFDLLDDYPEVLHIAYHPSSPYSNCIFSQHNQTENDARTNFYGIYGGTPRVVLQGGVIGFQNPILNQQQLEGELGMMSDYSISVEQVEQDGGLVDVTIEIEKVSGASDDLNLYAAIVEEYIDYASPNGENGHHNVFRKVLTDEAVNLPTTGNTLTINKSYTLDPEWGDTQMYVMAILQKTGSNQVVQAERSDNTSGGPSFITDNQTNAIKDLFYPNPAKDVIQINPEYMDKYVEACIYSIYGQLVDKIRVEDEIDISNLVAGQYIVVLTDVDNNLARTRIIKN